MIWRTKRGRWFDRFGHWHRWYAWKPVLLESADENEPNKLTRAWLCEVSRIGVVVRGRRYWLYARLEDVGFGYAPKQDELRWLAQRGEHLRAVT